MTSVRFHCAAGAHTWSSYLIRFLVIVVGGGWLLCSPADDAPAIAAAADLKFALVEIAELFTRESGKTVRISYGSSGNFARQIAHGAPFEMFLSADEGYVNVLFKEGFTLDQGVLYGVGRIAIFAPHSSPITPDSELKDLAAALVDGRLQKFAIANPEHAPYGRAARDALIKQGLWDRVQRHLVLGENAAQAAQFVISGSAQGGIIPYSLTLAPAVSSKGSFALLPAEWHTPLRQRMALLKNAGDTARQFYAFVRGPFAREIFKRYGFGLPEEAP